MNLAKLLHAYECKCKLYFYTAGKNYKWQIWKAIIYNHIRKFTQKCKGPGIAKTIQKKNKANGITLLVIESYEKAVITVWDWSKYRHRPMEQNIVQKEIHAYSVPWFMPEVTLQCSEERKSFQQIDLSQLVIHTSIYFRLKC